MNTQEKELKFLQSYFELIEDSLIDLQSFKDKVKHLILDGQISENSVDKFINNKLRNDKIKYIEDNIKELREELRILKNESEPKVKKVREVDPCGSGRSGFSRVTGC